MVMEEFRRAAVCPPLPGQRRVEVEPWWWRRWGRPEFELGHLKSGVIAVGERSGIRGIEG